MVEFDHVHQVADTCLAFLTEHLAADWRAPIPDIDGSVIEIVGHAAEGCLWYAVDLAAAGADVDAIELRVEVDGDPAGVV